MLRISIGTCTFRYFLLQYLVLEVSIKIRISAALFTNTNHFVHCLPQDNLAQQEMVSQQGLLLQQQKTVYFTTTVITFTVSAIFVTSTTAKFVYTAINNTNSATKKTCIIWQSSCNTKALYGANELQ